jgi:hypothetical protein
MSESANTRKSKALVLQSVAKIGQQSIVARLKTTAARVSRFFSGNGGLTFDEVLAAIDEAGLTIVRADAEMIDLSQKKEKEVYVKALETVLRHKLSEGEQ